MRVYEMQPCKILIHATRSTYGDRQEDEGIRSIRVYLTIIPNLHSGCLVEATIRLRSTDGGYPMYVCLFATGLKKTKVVISVSRRQGPEEGKKKRRFTHADVSSEVRGYSGA